MTTSDGEQNGLTFVADESPINTNSLFHNSHFAANSGSNVDIQLSVCNYNIKLSSITSHDAQKSGLVLEHAARCGHGQRPEVTITDSTFQNNTDNGLSLTWATPIDGVQ